MAQVRTILQNLEAPIYVAISNTGLDIDPFSNDAASGWRLCKTESILNESSNMDNVKKIDDQIFNDNSSLSGSEMDFDINEFENTLE